MQIRSLLVTAAAVGAAAAGGATIASAAQSSTTASSTATTTSTTSTTPGTTSTTTTAPQTPAPCRGPGHGMAAHEGAEKTVTGTAATQAQAAAVKSVGSGTAGTVTTDFMGNGYEVTVTKSDGTKVEVHLNSSFQVVQGPGRLGRPGGYPGAGPAGAPPAGAPYGA